MSDKLYIYTKRRARVDSLSQYVELIPKLYSDLYMNDDSTINSILKKLYKKYSTKDKLQLFRSILLDLSFKFRSKFIDLAYI